MGCADTFACSFLHFFFWHVCDVVARTVLSSELFSDSTTIAIAFDYFLIGSIASFMLVTHVSFPYLQCFYLPNVLLNLCVIVPPEPF